MTSIVVRKILSVRQMTYAMRRIHFTQITDNILVNFLTIVLYHLQHETKPHCVLNILKISLSVH